MGKPHFLLLFCRKITPCNLLNTLVTCRGSFFFCMLPPLVKPRLLITFLWDQLFSLPDPLLPHTLPHTRCAAANKLKNTAPQADALTHTPNKRTNNTHTHTTTSTTSADLLAHTRTAIVPTRLRTRGGIHCITIVQCRLYFFFFASLLQRCQETHTPTL